MRSTSCGRRDTDFANRPDCANRADAANRPDAANRADSTNRPEPAHRANAGRGEDESEDGRCSTRAGAESGDAHRGDSTARCRDDDSRGSRFP